MKEDETLDEFAERLINEIKEEEKEREAAVPGLIAELKDLPKHVIVLARGDGSGGVSIQWKGCHVGGAYYSYDKRWRLGYYQENLTFDTLRDAVVAVVLPFIRETDFTGYIQHGQEIIRSKDFDDPAMFEFKVMEKMGKGWRLLKWEVGPHDLDYQYAVLQDPNYKEPE